jgi:leucyl aminopeptidase
VIRATTATRRSAAGRTSRAGRIDVVEFEPVPSVERSARTVVAVSADVPKDADCVSIPVTADGEPSSRLGLSRSAMTASAFDGKLGESIVVHGTGGPTLVGVGIGDPSELDAAGLRDAAAAFTRAAGKHTRLAVVLPEPTPLEPEVAAQAVVEGVLLANYRYDALKRTAAGTELAELTLVAPAGDEEALTRGIERGRAFARAALLARDLGNAPPHHMTATRIAEIAAELGPERGLEVEIFGERELLALGCGGLLGVNRGSTEPPRMVRLTYTPATTASGADRTPHHLALVGKGVMYDSGGLSLKPSDPSHATMKTDMSGAAAVLGAMSALAELQCPTAVTAYLMCTDNMPSGSAMALGDVLTIRGGTTVEVMNTDAEGRLVMADALVLAAEDEPDAIISIATLTGAALRALGTAMAAVLGNSQTLVDEIVRSAERTGEQVWQLPLERKYRKELESSVADLRNLGGANAGTITAALFLEEFVDKLPWAHIDIAGTAHTEVDDSWRSKGATGTGTRLLIDAALSFAPPGNPAPSTRRASGRGIGAGR